MFFRALFSLIKIALLSFLAFALYKLIKFYIMIRGACSDKGFTKSASKKSTHTGSTVKCVNCDTYVADELSVLGRRNGKTVYFCSKRCKEEFLSKG